jgi:ribosomal protein L37AE/L43A
MPWKLRAYECEDCGKWTRRNRLSNDPWICAECGKDRQLLALRQGGRPTPAPPEPPASCAF